MAKKSIQVFLSLTRSFSRIVYLSMHLVFPSLHAQNPLIPNQGVNDPHIRIFEDKAYLYATHDRSKDNTRFAMDNWWIWSSEDLVSWKLESILKPEDTYIGKTFDQCWATDAAYRNGTYYWYFSEGNRQAGVVVGESPAGPWTDPLGKPLLDSALTPTDEYDMTVFQDIDGVFYILFGVWEYYMARLNEDMISLAEEPRKVVIHNPVGPYGEGSTDDKPFLHTYQGRYYLSWGAFYAVSETVYGPYEYVGTLMNEQSFAPGYAAPTWPHGPLQGRHGSFFEWHGQWYVAYCDMSQTGNRRFRDSFISYVHYRENGEIAPVRVDGIGVGQYDASSGRIEAEDYFKASGTRKKESGACGFVITDLDPGDYLVYPNIRGLGGKTKIVLGMVLNHQATIEIRRAGPEGDLLGECMAYKSQSGTFVLPACTLDKLGDTESICLVFKGEGQGFGEFDAFVFK